MKKSDSLAAIIIGFLLCISSVLNAQNNDLQYDVFSAEVFMNPPIEYRPYKIVHGFDKYLENRDSLTGLEGINEQLEKLKELGHGGVVANVGFEDYLQSERQWEIWRHGVKKAVDLGMSVWMYDDNVYPSGRAGGVVPRANPEYSAEGLSCFVSEAKGGEKITFPMPVSARAFVGASATHKNSGKTIDISNYVNEWGTLNWQVPEGEWEINYFARRQIYEGTFLTRIPYGMTHKYIDVLDPEAVKAFLRVTHQAYVRNTPPDLWKYIQAAFMDEPLFITPYLSQPEKRSENQVVLDKPFFNDRPASVIWTKSFSDKFRQLKGYSIEPHLRSVFTGETVDDYYVRQDYWDVATRLYTESFHQQIADWCEANGIASSGHTLAEEGLHGNIMFEGSLLEVIRPMQIPGIDMLNGEPESLMTKNLIAPKAVSSVAHLTGRGIVQSETSAHHQHVNQKKQTSLAQWKGQANVLYALGVNHFNLYYNWSHLGEEKYRSYTDYVARLSLLFQNAIHTCDVAVLYPVRTGWCWWTPWPFDDTPGVERGGLPKKMDVLANVYHDACQFLVEDQVDFDIVDERAVKEAVMKNGAMNVAKESYKVIILPAAEALELETLKALQQFAASGGIIIPVKAVPHLAESKMNQEKFDEIAGKLFTDYPKPVDLDDLTEVVKNKIAVDLQLSSPDKKVCYTHYKKDGREFYFVVNNFSEAKQLQPELRTNGNWKLYRPLTGKIEKAPKNLKISFEPYEGVFLVN